jgi:ParB family transcriptional regulator, chromosome partitioning protein
MNLSKIDSITKGKVKTTGVSPFLELELHKVYPNPNQPRKSFEDIDELAASISTNGLIQPIAVVKDGAGKYMIISGERRFRACTSLELKTIKVHIIEADSKKIEELSLIENIQRNDLTDFEVAKFVSMLWNSGMYEKKQDLAAAIGKPQSYISKVFKAVKLSDEIIADIEDNKKDIGLEILQELSNVKDKDKQLELYQSGAKRDEIRAATNTAKISPAKKTITHKEYMKEKQKVKEAFKTIPLSEKLPKTIDKMIYIVRGRTGGSEIYAKMLLSMLPSYDYEVCMNYWCYKSDSNDFQTMLELMENYSAYKWEYENLVQPYIQELKEFLGLDNG